MFLAMFVAMFLFFRLCQPQCSYKIRSKWKKVLYWNKYLRYPIPMPFQTKGQDELRRESSANDPSQRMRREKNSGTTPGSNFMMDAVDFLGKVSNFCDCSWWLKTECWFRSHWLSLWYYAISVAVNHIGKRVGPPVLSSVHSWHGSSLRRCLATL